MRTDLLTLPKVWLPLATLALIVAGGLARLHPVSAEWALLVWLAGLVVTGSPVVWRTLRDATRGHFATDMVAMLAIVTAVVLRQPLAGLIVVLMQTGGEALERYAEGRASDAIRELEAAAPRTAHRRIDTGVQDIAVDDVEIGDELLIRPGELVPCDCVVLHGRSSVDTARITGEAIPVSATTGTQLLSGTANLDGALTVVATARARESQYARIVELVRTAQESKSPLQRLADRYAVWFTPLTLVVCAGAYALTQDWVRVLAVLVVATPCPLILATPIAIIGGISRAARRQIIVRHGGALEQLSEVETAVFDKTGTLTIGHPQVSRVLTLNGFESDDVLRLAGAVEQGSGHLLARTVVEAAQARFGALPHARHNMEFPGRGIVAEVDGHDVAIGARAFILERHPVPAEMLAPVERNESRLRAYVAIDDHVAGVIEYADQLRPGLPEFFEELKHLGIRRTLLLSGDHTPNARAVAEAVGIREVKGDLLPEGKVGVVMQLEHSGERVLMVGDGVNDAPALTSAHVGVALAGHGGGITAEAADVVILVDELARVAEAIAISKRTLNIARQSILAGLGLSAAAMVVAAGGHIAPTWGAVLQEGIDVAVILNALRASR